MMASREHLAKAVVNFTDALWSEGPASRKAAAVDRLLDGDASFGLQLNASHAGILTVIVLQRLFDIGRMGVMALDQIGVVAVHRPNQLGQ
jgi:hypothetical protein